MDDCYNKYILYSEMMKLHRVAEDIYSGKLFIEERERSDKLLSLLAEEITEIKLKLIGILGKEYFEEILFGECLPVWLGN